MTANHLTSGPLTSGPLTSGPLTSGPLTFGTECWCASTAILSQPGVPGIAVDSRPRQPSISMGAR